MPARVLMVSAYLKPAAVWRVVTLACRQAHTAEAECRLKLASVQSHMLELSQEVSLAELALELAEARYNIMLAAGAHAVDYQDPLEHIFVMAL